MFAFPLDFTVWLLKSRKRLPISVIKESAASSLPPPHPNGPPSATPAQHGFVFNIDHVNNTQKFV